MHTIAGSFDSESNVASIRFLRDAKRSGTEDQSERYVALDEGYISQDELKGTYELAGTTRAAISGFINWLKKYEARKISNSEP